MTDTKLAATLRAGLGLLIAGGHPMSCIDASIYIYIHIYIYHCGDIILCLDVKNHSTNHGYL